MDYAQTGQHIPRSFIMQALEHWLEGEIIIGPPLGIDPTTYGATSRSALHIKVTFLNSQSL